MDHIPCGRVVGANAGLGQQFGRRDPGLKYVSFPQSLRKGQPIAQGERLAPVLGVGIQRGAGHAQIPPLNLVISGHLNGFVRIAQLFQRDKRVLRCHSTVTDLARFRGWSTSVPLCTAV